MTEKPVQLTVRLSPAERDAVVERAERHGMSASQLIQATMAAATQATGMAAGLLDTARQVHRLVGELLPEPVDVGVLADETIVANMTVDTLLQWQARLEDIEVLHPTPAEAAAVQSGQQVYMEVTGRVDGRRWLLVAGHNHRPEVLPEGWLYELTPEQAETAGAVMAVNRDPWPVLESHGLRVVFDPAAGNGTG